MAKDDPGDKVSLIFTPITYDVMQFVRNDKRFKDKSLNESLREVLARGKASMEAERN